MVARLLQAETRREVLRTRAYLLDYAANFVLFTLGFVLLTGLFELATEGSYSTEAVLASAVGYLTWRVADGCLLRIAGGLAEDASWGTLEQLFLSAISPHVILAARSLVIFCSLVIQTSLVAAVIFLLFGAWPMLSLAAMIVFVLTLLGVFGLGYALAGLHLIFKNVASLTVAVSTALLFVTGALVPLDNVAWLDAVTHVLPLTAGVRLLRDLTVYGMPVADLWSNPDLYWLLGTTVVWLAIGWTLLTWGYRSARQQGSLAHY